MDSIFVYILTIKTAQGTEVQVISADLYDYMQEQIGKNLSYEIPEHLINLHSKVPCAKNINKNVVLNEGTEQKDTWKHILGCSRNFKTENEAYKSLGNMTEYAGEIDVYLE